MTRRFPVTTVLSIMLCASQTLAQHALTLEASKQLAVQNNAQVKNSALEREAAQQTRKAALTKYFPSISAGGAMFEAQKNLMEISTQGGNLPVYDGKDLASLQTATEFAYMPASTMGLMKSGTVGMVTAVQPVFAGGRIVNGNKLASLGEDVSEYKNRMARNDVLLQTEEQYWRLVSLNEKLKTIQAYEDMLESLLRQVQDAFDAGLVLRNDLLKVRLKQSEVLLNMSKLENGKKLAEMAFCQHIGIPYDSTLVLADTLSVGGHPEGYYVEHKEALERRAEYMLLQASVRAEGLQSSMKLGEYLPQVGVGVSGLYMKLDEAKGRTVGMVFGTVSIPLSSWWEASHTLQERSAKEQMAENIMRDRSELLLLQMEKARRDMTDAYAQYALSMEAREQAEENLKLNSDSYRSGLTTVSDLLEAQALLQQSQDGLTDAKAQYVVKMTTYLQVTGR